MLKYSLSLIIFLTSIMTARSQYISVQETGNVNQVSVTSPKGIILTIPQTYNEFTAHKNIPNEFSSSSSPFNWILKFSAGNRVFKDISFYNTQVGYIVTELGAVYKTTNGGDNWTSVLNLGFPYYWYGVDALSADTVVISGFNNQGPINTGVVRWTFNGGFTWSTDIVLRRPTGGVGWLDRVHFFNQNTGLVMNALSGGCFVTTTGGKDTLAWSFVTINNDGAWFAGNIDAMNSGNVYATGIHLASSTNFGANWVSGPCADNVFDGGIDFLDNNTQFGWTGGGQISPTSAGWTHRSTDGGTNWGARLMDVPFPIRGVKFYNQNTGFAYGGNLFQESGGIYSTSNGGINWNLDINTSAEMFSLEYKAISADSMDVWCVGSTGGGTGYTGRLYKARLQNLVGISLINSQIPRNFNLYQNYPNPFNPVTKIKFSIPLLRGVSASGGRGVLLIVYDMLGRKIDELVNRELNAGTYEVSFDGAKYSSGVYFYSLISGDYKEVRKMVLVK